jgi:hypothetical protein
MTDTAPGPQSGLFGNDSAQELVSVQTSLHEELGLALTDQFHSPRRSRMTVRCVHNPRFPEINAAPFRDFGNFGGGTYENWCNQAFRARL